jgi:hypothetical protein
MFCIEFRNKDTTFFYEFLNENRAAKKMTSFCSHCEIFRNCCENYWLNKIRANVIFVKIFNRLILFSFSRSSIIKRIRESQIDWITIENLSFFKFKKNCIIFKNLCIQSRTIRSFLLNFFLRFEWSDRNTKCTAFAVERIIFAIIDEHIAQLQFFYFFVQNDERAITFEYDFAAKFTNYIEFANAIDIEDKRESSS